MEEPSDVVPSSIGSSVHASRVFLSKLYTGLASGYEREARNGGLDLGPFGELLPAASVNLLRTMALTNSDVFYDLGSGLGKLVLLAAATTPAARCIGVELSRGRLAAARAALARAEAARLISPGRCRFRQEDLFATDLHDVTVAYCCSTAFPDIALDKLATRLSELPRLRLWATLREPRRAPGFRLVRCLRLDTSWKRRERVLLYEPLRLYANNRIGSMN